MGLNRLMIFLFTNTILFTGTTWFSFGDVTFAQSKKPKTSAIDESFSSPLAVAELERIDSRKPVPLSPMMANHQKQNMREHLQAVQAIIDGIARDDFSAVEKAAKTMGYSEEMRQMCTHMGAGAPGFTERAIAFHKSADKIADAAKFKNRSGTLQALNTTLQTCTSCHAMYRQQVIDDTGQGSKQHLHKH